MLRDGCCRLIARSCRRQREGPCCFVAALLVVLAALALRPRPARLLSHPQRRDHRALRARRLDRHRRAHCRAEAAGPARPVVRRAQPAGRQRHHRPQRGDARHSGRLHAVEQLHRRGRGGAADLQDPQVFDGGRLRADRDHRPRSGGADGVEERQGRQAARTSSPRCAPIRASTPTAAATAARRT